MIDNLEDAIQHCKEKEEELKKQHSELLERPNFDRQIVADCWECARDHEQLAAWLEELRDRRNADRWIPVTERLPEESDFYLVTITDEHITYVNTLFFTKRTAYMWEHGKRIIAWKPLPKPYESKATNED